MKIVFNGQAYESPEAMPPEVRNALENLPPPRPEDVTTVVNVQTRVSEPKVNVSFREFPVREETKSGAALVRRFVVFLIGVHVVLLILWLSGMKPADGLHR